MSRQLHKRLLLALILTLLGLPQTSYAAPVKLSFSGGPDGGTFQYFSNGIATRLTSEIEDLEVINLSSAGSVENIRRVDAGEADFGIAYSGDIYLARKGKLGKDPKEYRNVLAIAYLYGAPAHLVTLADSGIFKVSDLEGRRVAVGGAGSGAAAAAQRYFTGLDLWSKMKIELIGYTKAAQALSDGQIDAIWVFAGFPNSSVSQVAANKKIRILDTWQAGKDAGLFKTYPFYSRVTIPAGTYIGVDQEIKTFQDSALWVAGKQVRDEVADQALKTIFSPEGLEYMVKVKSTAKAMSLKRGMTGIVTPVHPGAQTFWREKGLTFFPTD
jgi:TRAP transporter TAXI family solute receptor